MIQAGNGARFALKALTARWIAGEVGRQDFDGNRPVEAGVMGAINLPHPARANRVQDLVGSQPNSGDNGIWLQFYTGKGWLHSSGRFGIRSATAYILGNASGTSARCIYARKVAKCLLWNEMAIAIAASA